MKHPLALLYRNQSTCLGETTSHHIRIGANILIHYWRHKFATRYGGTIHSQLLCIMKLLKV